MLHNNKKFAHCSNDLVSPYVADYSFVQAHIHFAISIYDPLLQESIFLYFTLLYFTLLYFLMPVCSLGVYIDQGTPLFSVRGHPLHLSPGVTHLFCFPFCVSLPGDYVAGLPLRLFPGGSMGWLDG